MITLKESDADEILAYFRDQLKEENENFAIAMSAEVPEDKVPKALKEKLDMFMKAAHEHNVKIYTHYIELLTCGSE